MKPLNKYIQEKLIINKDYKDYRYHDNMIVVKSFDELRKIIEDRYDKLGAGTKQDPIDFNDIDVSNIDSFCNDRTRYKGIFVDMDFKYIDISDWDVSNVKSMRQMFCWCKELKSFGDISNWNVSNVTDMNHMFFRCKYFNQDISKWDVSSVTDMNGMFCGCKSFNQDLSNWDVSNLNHLSYILSMFDKYTKKSEYKPKFK